MGSSGWKGLPLGDQRGTPKRKYGKETHPTSGGGAPLFLTNKNRITKQTRKGKLHTRKEKRVEEGARSAF